MGQTLLSLRTLLSTTSHLTCRRCEALNYRPLSLVQMANAPPPFVPKQNFEGLEEVLCFVRVSSTLGARFNEHLAWVSARSQSAVLVD